MKIRSIVLRKETDKRQVKHNNLLGTGNKTDGCAIFKLVEMSTIK